MASEVTQWIGCHFLTRSCSAGARDFMAKISWPISWPKPQRFTAIALPVRCASIHSPLSVLVTLVRTRVHFVIGQGRRRACVRTCSCGCWHSAHGSVCASTVRISAWPCQCMQPYPMCNKEFGTDMHAGMHHAVL